jgi:hypothetical protein
MIKKIFNNKKELPTNGQLTANLWSAGQQYRVTIDDMIPGWQRNNFLLYGAPPSKDGALWVPLLEKALAKL